jgi:hypothetical protein
MHPFGYRDIGKAMLCPDIIGFNNSVELGYYSCVAIDGNTTSKLLLRIAKGKGSKGGLIGNGIKRILCENISTSTRVKNIAIRLI